MDSLMPQPARAHYPGYAVKANDGAHVLDGRDKKRANALEQRFNQSDKQTCLVDKADSENTFVAIPSSRGNLRLYLVSDGVGTTPLAQSSKGVLFSSVRLHKEQNHDWLVCDKGVMQVPNTAVGDRADSTSVEKVNGDVNLYRAFRDIPGGSTMQRVPYGNFNDVEKFEFAQRLLQTCETISKTGRSVETVIRPEAIRLLGGGKEIVLINDACTEKTPEGARVKGTYGKVAYHFPEGSGHRVSQEQKDVLACAVFLMNLFSEQPEGCSAAKVTLNGDHAYVDRKEHLIMKGAEKIAPEVRSSCIQIFKDMSSSRASARPDLSACFEKLSEQGEFYQGILRSVESNEADAIRRREDVHSLQLQIANVTKSKDLESGEKEKQLSFLEKQLSEAKGKLEEYEENLKSIIESKELMEQSIKKQEKELKRKDQALQMERSERKKLVEEKDGLVQAHEELIRKQKELLREAEGLGGKIQESAREREQLNLRNASDKKCFEDEAQHLKDELAEKQQKINEVTLQLKTVEKARQECDQANRERSRRALGELKSLASNDNAMKKVFVDRIPGGVLAWPLDERIGVLDDICLHVILNPNETYKQRGSSQSYRPFINFTQTQIDHLNALRAQAMDVVKEMIKGGDALIKQKACEYLDNSLVLHFQASHTLEPSDKKCQAEWQELMVASPEIWRFRKPGERCDQKLAYHFKDGRGGDAAKGKELSQYMKHISTLGREKAGQYLLHSYMSDKSAAVDKLKALESLFCYVAFDPKAYTRGEGHIVTDSAEALWDVVAGASHPREDIVEPTRTKVDHIMLMQQAYRQVLTEFKGKPLTVSEVKALSESRLAEFIPGQYQHEVERQRVSTLRLEVQSILEERQNSDRLKQYYKEKYELKL